MNIKSMTGALALAGLAALSAPQANAGPALALSAPMPATTTVAALAQWGLGIVADGRRVGEEGVLVLAVSPASAAERLGVRPGDRLLAVNGHSLTGVSAPNALIQQALADGDGQVRLELERDGEALVLSGRAEPALAAGGSAAAQPTGCGYVSARGVQPRVSRNIFPAEITQINGRSTPLDAQDRYQVPVGRQVLVVREFIDRHRISNADRQRIGRMQRREVTGAYKTLVVDVEPDVRYSIGAELLPDRMDPDSIRANAWWQPVVWESRPETCR